MTRKRGLLLLNLGTPDEPSSGAVARYLREFLGDGRVIDINPLARWVLVNLIIAPTRAPKSAEAYRKVWTDRGSPLLFHSQDLTRAVAARLPDTAVELAMRYGNPSIPQALGKLRERGVRELTVFPLYPQNASSSTGSSLERVYELVGKHWDALPIRAVPPFFDDARFISAFAMVARPVIAEARADHVLFSFHGLPARHLHRQDGSRPQTSTPDSCCTSVTAENAGCYRAQSFETARAIAAELGLSADGWSVSFQSRLGRTPWIKPYTDVVLPELIARGAKRVAVVCPSFVADCLETLEEIRLRAREDFRSRGGEELVLVPSLNAHPSWVDAVVSLATR